MTENAHIQTNRKLAAEAREKIAEHKNAAWYHECALRGLLKNTEMNLLVSSGLEGCLVEDGPDRFIVDRWIETEAGPLVEGRYINKKGKVSPSWRLSAPPDRVKSLGKWGKPQPRLT